MSHTLRSTGGHPLGLKPWGNLIMASGQGVACRRDAGLGSMRCLPDEVLLHIMECLDAAALERVGSCSKQLYVTARHQPLWKQLTADAFPSGFDFCTNWRTTWQRETARAAGRLREGAEPPPAMKVEGVYSDLLFQHWLCSSMFINPKWLRVSNIDKVHALDMTPAAFTDRYERPGIPVVIQGVCNHWPAFSKWTDQYLSASSCDAKFRCGAADLTMQQFLSYRSRYSEEAPLILFDKRFCERAPALATDFSVPQFFTQDLFNVLGPLRPDYRWLIIAAARSGSFFHKDPNYTSAWNACVRGRKKWIMLPPEFTPPGVYPCDDGSEVTVPLSVMEWFMNHYDEAAEGAAGCTPLETICEAGEVMFVPRGWWHCVLNVDDTVAVTQNYVSDCNLAQVLHFLRTKSDQVSGCSHGARLHGMFVDALNAQHPGKVDAALQQAQAKQAKRSMWAQLTSSHSPASNDNKKFRFNFSSQPQA
jgi:hypothetical protein